MNKPFFTLQNAKPLLLASAVALALTACGGSGGSNAPTPDQPSKPIAPESGKKPESNAKPQAQQPKNNGGNAGNGNTGSGNADGNMTPPKKPDSPKDPAPSPKDPAPSPKDPAPAPKDPAPAPKDPAPAPKDPAPAPKNPAPSPKDPAPSPKDPAPSPKDPAPAPKDPAPAPKDPAPSPKDPELTDPGTTLHPAEAWGSGVITYSRFAALPEHGGGAPKHNEELVEDTTVDNSDQSKTFKVIENGVILNKVLAGKISEVVEQQVTLKLPASGTKKTITVDMVGIGYRAKRFGYQEAQAFHYYGLVGEKPFGVAYSMGKLASQQAMQQLQGNIVYQGPASFLEKGVKSQNRNVIDPVLESGSAIITLNTAEKKLDAVITLPQRFNKSYSFDQISYKDTSIFDRADQDKAIRGHFYGDQAQHIGGTYYVPEGAGAFITEKQP